MVCSVADYRNDVKMFKTLHACGLWFHLSFEHFDVISLEEVPESWPFGLLVRRKAKRGIDLSTVG